jgi:alternate signal-mediated exported protein
MNKTTKGALAAGAAGALLLGGAGSLAYWTATETVDGASVNSGTLTLTDSTEGGSCAEAPWKIDAGELPASADFDPATELLVPGDVITKTCTYTLGATGTHLRATLGTTGGTASGALSSALTVSSTFKNGTTAVSEVTEADDGATLTAEISVTFQGASGNSTQAQTAALADYVVTLTQAHA